MWLSALVVAYKWYFILDFDIVVFHKRKQKQKKLRVAIDEGVLAPIDTLQLDAHQIKPIVVVWTPVESSTTDDGVLRKSQATLHIGVLSEAASAPPAPRSLVLTGTLLFV